MTPRTCLVPALALAAVACAARDKRVGSQPTTAPAKDGRGGRPASEGTRAEPGTISGRVLDPGGRALAGAAVSAIAYPAPGQPSLPGMHAFPIATRADASGAFHFEGLPSERYTVSASAPGLVGAFAADVVPGGAGQPIELRLTRGGVALTGRIRNAAGRPVAGARVRAISGFGWLFGPAQLRAFETESDGEGRYRVQLAADVYSLAADAEGYAPARAHQVADLGADETRDFHLEPGARISGRVVTDSGVPAAGARVQLLPAGHAFDAIAEPTASDAAGHFRFAGLAATSYRLIAHKGGLATLTPPITVSAGGAAEGVEVRLAPGLSIAGRVAGPDGRPIRGARVHVTVGTYMFPPLDPDEVVTDEGGRFTIAGLLPARCRVFAWSPHHALQEEKLLLREPATKDFVLDPLAEVGGEILTARGQPAASALVTAVVEGEAGKGGTDLTTADAQGRFRLRLPAGKVTLFAQAGDDAVTETARSLAPGERRSLTVRLRPGVRISGQVSWDDGTPARGIRIIGGARAAGPVLAESRSAADGTFDLGPLPAGDVSVVPELLGGGAPGAFPDWELEPVEFNLAAGGRQSGVKLVVARLKPAR